jgi:hypothetical protein
MVALTTMALLVGIVAATSVSASKKKGSEGCTPGYWKQEQHFGSWSGGYVPNFDSPPGTLFDDVFDNAFPGKTLLDVLWQGGGGLNALGRHTVAALLNTVSPDVKYHFIVGSGNGPKLADLISQFNAAYASGDYEGQKDIFAGFNELGCPLGRNP